MTKPASMNFGDDSIARAYDTEMVPVVFRPWAEGLLEEHGPWAGLHTLDLAAGTGVVTRLLQRSVGPSGRVVAVDPNSQMLDLARAHVEGRRPEVEFVECPADSLAIEDASCDVIVCQQGFQFFPDRDAAAREMYRVLRRGGRVIATTWKPVEECAFFGAVCAALQATEQAEIEAVLRVPFDHMPGDELAAHFKGAGFADVGVVEKSRVLVLPGGARQALRLVYAAPIGPRLRDLPGDVQDRFRADLVERVASLGDGESSMGELRAHEVTARKPAR